jgi:hypothetical protein
MGHHSSVFYQATLEDSQLRCLMETVFIYILIQLSGIDE